MTRGVDAARRIEPGGNSAIGWIAVTSRQIQLGIERPDLGPSGGIQRAYATKWRGRVEHAVDEQGRRFVAHRSTSARKVAGAISPDLHQVAYILTRDLARRRVFRSRRIPTVRRPLHRS